LRVPATIGDRLVLRAIRETRGAAVAVSDEAMQVASQNLASLEGIPACLEGAATLAGFRRLYDDGLIVPEDHVVLVNTGSRRGIELPSSAVPTVRSAEEARSSLGLTSRVP
jgi:threonine synthase